MKVNKGIVQQLNKVLLNELTAINQYFLHARMWKNWGFEKLWKKIKQQDTRLHYFPTFEALTEKVEQALLKFTNAPEEILALCSLPTELAQAA